ncbi:E1-E2 ATPase-domain-containing protein [Phycomyces nitens]|nr:E1-E2 ATPase-domain-containing protein [Phycomyces nitens]
MILWCYFYLAYWQIGISDTLVILLAAIIKVVIRLRSEHRIKKMAEHVTDCNVLRDNQWKTLSSAQLVPGDVVQLEIGQVMPADAVLLRHDAVVDESSLTGEPLPVRKVPLRNDGQDYSCDTCSDGKVHSLFAGTTIQHTSHKPLALVLATRTNTDKGKLIQKILYPQDVSFIFHEQLKLVFCILMAYALILLVVGSWWLGGTGMTAWFYGTICAAQVMNPLLPAMLVVGQSVAAGRLKEKEVFCVDLPRILMAGKVQVFCFDKTGTLTKEGLEYYGTCPSHATNEMNSKETAFGNIVQTISGLDDTETGRLMKIGLSVCHSVTHVGTEVVGNPVDSAMFRASGAHLCGTDEIQLAQSDTNHVTLPLKVLRRFEFEHGRALMSVVVLDTETKHVHVFCKGAFERIENISSNTSVPSEFDSVTSHMAREGLYVLGMAHLDLGSAVDSNQVATWSRDTLESNQLQFLGLILFRNSLREDTASAISALQNGSTRTVMITGDNVLTAAAISRASGLMSSTIRLVTGNVENLQVIWRDVDTHESVQDIHQLLTNGNVELALSGNAFDALVNTNKIRDLLFETRIFARMTPVNKRMCVELLMERTITAMCGDGGNDCGALRAAHVGIAMSEAEASVVSPFSTPRRSIQACVDLLIEGRAALATSFASYKYLIMYGETMATVKFFTFYYTMSFSQWNFILVDAFITVFCAFAVTRAGPATTLSSYRPTARILGPQVLLSVLGQLAINVGFLVGAFVWLYSRDDFFRCNEWDSRATDTSKWWLLGDSFEASVLTFVSLFQFVNAALIFNYGHVFRESWVRNYLLITVWVMFVGIVSYWELADPNFFGCLVRLNCGNPDALVSLGYPRPDFLIEPYNSPLGHNVLPKEFRYRLWAYSVVNMLVTNTWELVVVMGPVHRWQQQNSLVQRFKVRV